MAKATVTEKVTTTKTYHLELTEEEVRLVRDLVGATTAGRDPAGDRIYEALESAGIHRDPAQRTRLRVSYGDSDNWDF